MRSESKPSVSSFNPVAKQREYLTISKGEHSLEKDALDETFRETNSSVAIGFHRAERMSNFSAQYRNFKHQRKAKGSERRNINPTTSQRKKNHMTCDMYFHG